MLAKKFFADAGMALDSASIVRTEQQQQTTLEIDQVHRASSPALFSGRWRWKSVERSAPLHVAGFVHSVFLAIVCVASHSQPAAVQLCCDLLVVLPGTLFVGKSSTSM